MGASLCAGRDDDAPNAAAHRGWKLGDSQSPEHPYKYKGPGPHFTCSPDGEVPPRYAERGVASEKETPGTTLIALLTKAALKHGDKNAFMVEMPVPAIVDNKVPPALASEYWIRWTYQQYHDDVGKAAKGFITLGLGRLQFVNIWGFSAPEWHISALVASFAGAKGAGLYPTDTPEAAAYKVVHSQGAICDVEDMKKVDTLAVALSARGDCKRLKAFVAHGFLPAEGAAVVITPSGKVPIPSWEAMVAGAAQTSDELLTERVAGVQPGAAPA